MNTNSTLAYETRREAYEDILPKVNDRQKQILAVLGGRELTVSEIMEELWNAGFIPYMGRNFVAPRLSELKDLMIVETCGKRPSKLSGKNEAVWRRTSIRRDNK